MKTKLLRIVLFVVGALVVLVAAGAAYVKLALPNVGPAPELAAQADSGKIARGKYLATHVAVCMDCHSARDWGKLTAPMVTGTEGKGGEAFLREHGLPGNYYAPNLTPSHLGEWTDGEIYRAITSGVSRDGRALFPIMPYPNFNQLDQEDILSIIAYIRTLKPIDHAVPASESDFPMNFIINTIPKAPTGGKRPSPENTVEYGRYLATMASCGECHTPAEQGQPVPGMDFAGGREFFIPPGTVRSMNITPSKTGIGSWSRQDFIAKFKYFAANQTAVNEKDFNTVMPWSMYGGMTEQDLGAIYDYLRTVKPVDNTVERFVPKGKEIASN